MTVPGTTQISAFMPAECASCTCKLMYGTDARALTFPPPHFPLLSITHMECQCGINSGDDVLILNDGILNDVLILNVQHFLALFFHHLMM